MLQCVLFVPSRALSHLSSTNANCTDLFKGVKLPNVYVFRKYLPHTSHIQTFLQINTQLAKILDELQGIKQRQDDLERQLGEFREQCGSNFADINQQLHEERFRMQTLDTRINEVTGERLCMIVLY